MAVRTPAELDFSDKKFMAIISGQPGLGKTTLALSAPKPFLFDTDNGVARVKAEHRNVLTGISSCSSYYELLNDKECSGYKEAETAIIDTGGTLVQLMKGWAKDQDSRAAKNGQAMFGVIKGEFDRLQSEIRLRDKKHLVVVFHTTEQMKNDKIQTRLSCEGSSKDIVWTPADFGGHMFVEGRRTMIGFSPTDEYFAKGCFGVTGVMPVPTLQPRQPNDFMTRLFQSAQQRISEEAQIYQGERDAYQAAMEQGKKIIAAVSDPDTAKEAAELIGSKISHALTSKAELRCMLKNRTNEMRLRWNKEAGAYEVLDDTKPSE